jgi:AcrR family transcriptional regulator
MNKKPRRTYEMKERAKALDQTRRRITQVTVELHRTVGPAATSISEVARRAGVQRVTVYNHFPNEASLLSACSAHWRSLHPTPDLSSWTAIADPKERLRTGLRELYAWYEETEPMTANVLRDAQVLPILRKLIDKGLGAYLTEAQRVLSHRPQLRGKRKARVEAAVAVAVDFHTWRALTGLGDEAVELAARFVDVAAE